MQVVFSIEEFRLLVHILREYSETGAQPQTSLQTSASVLLQKILVRDFCFSIDELEDLEEILKAKESTLHLKPGEEYTQDRAHTTELMGRLLDRITEACAMG